MQFLGIAEMGKLGGDATNFDFDGPQSFGELEK